APATPGGVPAGGLPRRRGRLLVQGDRRDHGYPDRHRDVPAAPGPAQSAPPTGELRRRTGPGADPRDRSGQREGGGAHVSRGDPHEADCREVLEEVYLYLDLECSPGRRDVIRAHLDECSPCLREYGIEQEVKALVG